MDSRTLTQSLGGRWYSNYGTAPCPVCQADRRNDQNALTLSDGSDGRLLAHCKRLGCDFRDIVSAAGLTSGGYRPPDAAKSSGREVDRRATAAKRARQAERLWQNAQPTAATPAERYLRKARGISCKLPPTLRFHSACWHGATAKRHPALVALVEGSDGFAMHRTYLRPDGSGKAAVLPNKMMLGAVAGGAVRLSDGPGPLLVGEGIESTLSAFILHDVPTARAWAALSANGMTGLRLPDIPARLIIAPDGDKVGLGAAMTLADRAALEGWAVSILTPPNGGDFNDVLRGEVTA